MIESYPDDHGKAAQADRAGVDGIARAGHDRVIGCQLGNRETVDVMTAVVTRGDVVRRVMVSGTLQPAKAVAIGSQVPGTIQSIDADFNDRVRAGQIVARLDRSIYQARLEEALAKVAHTALPFRPSRSAFAAVGQDPPALELPRSDVDPSRRDVRSAYLWTFAKQRFVPLTVAVGISDDHWTEIVDGPLRPGEVVLTDAVPSAASRIN